MKTCKICLHYRESDRYCLLFDEDKNEDETCRFHLGSEELHNAFM